MRVTNLAERYDLPPVDWSMITDRLDAGLSATPVARWAEGWPCKVDESGIALTADYSAPSAGGPPWSVYRITMRSATALALQAPGGATRWSFDN
jgi:hypothetical protein